MPRYLLSYEIAFASKQGHIAGHAFVTMDRLTQGNLDAVAKEIRADSTVTEPLQDNIVWRSVARLDE